MLLSVGDELGAGVEVPLAPRGNDLDVRLQAVVAAGCKARGGVRAAGGAAAGMPPGMPQMPCVYSMPGRAGAMERHRRPYCCTAAASCCLSRHMLLLLLAQPAGRLTPAQSALGRCPCRWHRATRHRRPPAVSPNQQRGGQQRGPANLTNTRCHSTAQDHRAALWRSPGPPASQPLPGFPACPGRTSSAISIWRLAMSGRAMEVPSR